MLAVQQQRERTAQTAEVGKSGNKRRQLIPQMHKSFEQGIRRRISLTLCTKYLLAKTRLYVLASCKQLPQQEYKG